MKTVKSILKQYPVSFFERENYIELFLGNKYSPYEKSISFCFSKDDDFKLILILMGVDAEHDYKNVTVVNGVEVHYHKKETLKYWRSQIEDIKHKAKKFDLKELEILDRAFAAIMDITKIDHPYPQEKALQFAIKIVSEDMYQELKDWDTEGDLEPYMDHVTDESEVSVNNTCKNIMSFTTNNEDYRELHRDRTYIHH